jgi:penicillin-binding protein 2
VPSAEWKRKHYSGERYNEVDRIWYDGDTANLAIGQGYLLATPIQVLMMANAIVNNGVTRKPALLKGTKSATGVDAPRREPPLVHSFDSLNLELMQRGMRRAVLLGGTAEELRELSVPVAGKTGTAEVWMGEPHSWFVGYFPSGGPQVSFVVFLENGGSSHDVAVPIAKGLIAEIARILNI